MKNLNSEKIKSIFKKVYLEEFEDPNESFMDFLLDLIPKKILLKTIIKGKDYYSSIFYKYK